MRDLLVHEEDIQGHLAKIGMQLQDAKSIIDQVGENSESEADILQAEFLEHLGGFSSVQALLEAVEDAYNKAVSCVEELNSSSSVLGHVSESVSDGGNGVDMADFAFLAGLVALLTGVAAITIGANPLMMNFVPGAVAAFVVTKENREITAGAAEAAMDAAGGAVEGISEVKSLTSQANKAIDDLGAFSQRLEESCQGLASRAKCIGSSM